MFACSHTAVVNVGEEGAGPVAGICVIEGEGGEALLNMGLLNLYSSCFLTQVNRRGILYHGPCNVNEKW